MCAVMCACQFGQEAPHMSELTSTSPVHDTCAAEQILPIIERKRMRERHVASTQTHRGSSVACMA
jgi:hypothetical protein